MKNFLRRMLRSAGVDVVRYSPKPEAPIDVLALAIRERAARKALHYFVQVGAHDGVSHDPIRQHIIDFQLHGLCIEPLPEYFSKLKANYAGQPGIAFEQCAVGEADGTATLYKVRPDPSLPPWAVELASFNRDHLNGKKFNCPGLENFVEPVQVPVRSLGSLLKQHGRDSLDLLQVDTEGYDCTIILNALNSGLRPAIINYETIHAPVDQQIACKQKLKDCGYHFLDIGWDTTAILPGA